MNIIMKAVIDYFEMVIQGSKILIEYFFSPQGIDYFVNGGGWLVFLKGVLKGIFEARYGLPF